MAQVVEDPSQEIGLDAADPYLRQAQIYPRLSEEMAARVAGYGRTEVLPEGTSVFTRGERSVDFFLVLRGSIEILDQAMHGEVGVVTVHSARQFTGELDLFNDRRILVSGRTRAETEVVRLPRADFRRMVSSEPDIAEILMRAFILRRVGFIVHAQAAVTLIGPSHSSDTLRLARFLSRNGYPHKLLDTELDADAGGFLACFQIRREELPVVILDEKRAMRNPSNADLADQLGLTEESDPSKVYDLAIVGAGPSGLAAAVYAASEGLATIVIEGVAPGGQAGTSSKIENYLGFPTGISGQALAGRAQVQAKKFGARLAISRHVIGIECDAVPFVLRLDDDHVLRSRAIAIATGARYRKLDVPNFAKFEGQGIHYAATAIEQRLCGDEAVAVVGGGNSAGQAAIFLSRTAAHVHMLVRGAGLSATMSDYLVQRIENSRKITLYPFTEITALDGDDRLRHVTWTHRSGERRTEELGNIFLMIGAAPNNEWLDGCVELDARGFVKTGSEVKGHASQSVYATSHPGIFAVGDVRAGSIKRVAAGVGEGSAVVQSIHRYLHPESS